MKKSILISIAALVILIAMGSRLSQSQTCRPAVPDLTAYWTGDAPPLEVRNRNNGALQFGANYADGKIGQTLSE